MKSCASWRNRKPRQQAEHRRACDEGDRKRKLEESDRRELEEAARKAREVVAAVTRRCQPTLPDVATELRTRKHAPRPHKADRPRTEPKSPAPSRPPLNKSPANAPGNKTAPKHKARGSHAMVDNEGEDDATPACSSPASCI